MEFVTLPDRRAAQDPHGPAVADRSGSLTNSELLDAVVVVARRLHALGIGAGDVVAVRLNNRIEFVLLLFAAWRLGAVVTPVNPSLTEVEVARQSADSGARLLVVEDESPAPSGVPTLGVGDLHDPVTGPDPVPHVDSSALALLIYTSGTTGVPKGVMLDHANLDAMTAMGRLALEVGPADRGLLILPLFHVNGIVVSVLTPLLAGASVFIADRFRPNTFFELVESERPTFFSAVPTIYSMLAALPEDVRPDTSSVRFAVCGAAPAVAHLLARFEDRYGFPIVEGYGLSEATCGSTVNPVSGLRKAGTVGLPFPGQDLRIIDGAGNELPPGVDGQVVVRGPNVMRGYLGRPDETAAVIIDGWLHTGDVGHLDADGYLTLVGRSKELIIRGGENIYPKEIEDVLASDPAVLEAAVIGMPDDTWGEVVVAFVQARPGATIELDGLKARCATSLSGYKRPKSIHILEALPKNAVGKLDKKSLRNAQTVVT
ncbi:Acyl-CoA synthetase (AMP-forming)/AMP-acid ligase II [Actinokineospora alba]|uniref:Acyl-CoA synthetase (AMP-forming)/AMP-acid ligase II n=1 Tax=Actinokineospora alba TaxID=504798 RepID=A0A1H0FD97_9PSEU|nr:AMP-binding protein [Actinokineospora alba]TDP69430.1 acyl-CoA synthetase (AMP-forming)/AMP-acid ligase II [Actinokineospora alba]SDI16971.1 Acyl-CoA synthetase (AMP-forming)/AMP-acid ligase II [Actinokineospora alba]SDN92492.1 Acyl-CoA synthetase (AMP-forming)/AMP-acid ligase II [Actinokineospora alba]